VALHAGKLEIKVTVPQNFAVNKRQLSYAVEITSLHHYVEKCSKEVSVEAKATTFAATSFNTCRVEIML